MATEPVLTIELDWMSKSGSADATIGFGETFDLRLTGLDDAEVNGYLWLTLIQDSVPTKTSKELWSYKTPEKVSSTNGEVVLENLCIFTQEVEEVLRSQGGKGRLFLAVREMRDDGAIDYGVVRLTVAIGSYIKDPSSPEKLEGVTISALVKSLSKANESVESAKKFAESASESAKQAVLVMGKKQDKLTAGPGISITEGGVISATGGSGGGTPYLAIAACSSCTASAYERSIAIGGYARANSPDTIAIGEEAYAPNVSAIVIGNYSCTNDAGQILIGHRIDGSHGARAYVDAFGLPDVIILQACNTSVFFSNDACNNYETMIGFKNSGGCYETRRIEDAFCSSGGDSYIKSSPSGSPYDIPGCSSGIAIGTNACICADVTNGLAIGYGVEATTLTPVRIGNGCSAITVNNKYELCVGGKPVGGGGTNDSICVYDSEGYCAVGIGEDYVAIGDKAIAYSDSVAVGVSTYANKGEVAIGVYAGNDAKTNGFISENSLKDVRRFRACASSLGNELFFATKDGRAVLGGEFSKVDGGDSGVTTNYCYFYLQDVADMLANGGGSGASVMIYDDGFTIGTHAAEGGLTTGISYNNKNAQRNPNTLETWKDGEQVSKEQIATLDALAEYAMPIVTTANINGAVNSYAYVGSLYHGQPVVGVSFDTVNRAVENGGKISVQFFEKATGSSYGEVKEEAFVPSLENFNALAERVAALEAQLVAAAAILESNLCVSGVEPLANENGTEVHYSQNPTGLLEGDELL